MSVALSHERCLFLHIDGLVKGDQEPPQLDVLRQTIALTSCPNHLIKRDYIDNNVLADIIKLISVPLLEVRRKILLLSGAYLEHQLTAVSLEALAEGFHVHLLCDCIVASDKKMFQVLQLRLLQAGCVPTSLEQFLYLWQMIETDEVKRAQFQSLIGKCQKLRRSRLSRPGLS
jgi:hypothetical protein